ncbi:hypothetical protein BGX33_012367, partial [Mortierella sp. NVP41]
RDNDRRATKTPDYFKDRPDHYYNKDYLLMTPQEASTVDLWNVPLPADLWENLKRIWDDYAVIVFGKTRIPVDMPMPCQVYETRWEQDEDRMKEFLKDKAKLRAMDLFAGCGGLSLGLERSGVVDTRYAVKQDKSAASTFQQNFPNTRVETGREWVIRPGDLGALPTKIGKELEKAELGDTYDVGPRRYRRPLRRTRLGFPTANTGRDGSDARNSLIATTMSFVEVYPPRYFLLKNVTGMIDIKWRRTGWQWSMSDRDPPSRQPWRPQSRYRFFVWAAQLGHTLPTFPLPTTALKFDNRERFTPPLELVHNGHHTLDYRSRRGLQGPDPMVSIRNAVSDLPGFEYCHPDDIDPKTKKLKQASNSTNGTSSLGGAETGVDR